MFKKYSSQELLHQMGQYLAWSIPRTRNSSWFKWSLWGHKWPRAKGT